ncbi:low molecular weight protein tyrosine phosphatase family protein [Pseudomonas sp. Gutcm_11s]|uniref:low molecular weight protein tyrosine phosphatase family protein n=1 Tax=Pseudomonas sp. Gutcm_11s TaxID=3026088 RepID=UPI0023622C5A|nr:low molecular weight protein tyrosine phosphatase family protein [Pseudomonas sp. Gutcm_11s]MDD0844159.1 low molecular weight protein tyrosine phosphatase family protein [Pseudomonas sp. Gutcm_11s]
MPRALFICSRNRLRSPTAEQIFAAWPGVESDSAGLAPDAEVQLCAEQVEWAELIFVMERVHQRRLQQRFGALLKGRRVICLAIADDYQFMQPELIELLERKAGAYLR